jgi:MATE family multidrug resistance protein
MVIALLAVALLWAAPQTIFALMTSHSDIVAAMMAYRGWLYATLLLGAVAFIYDGLFLGLTEGVVLRNAMLASTLLVYSPLALLAQQRASVSLLWVAMVLFMGARAISLGSRQKAAIERCVAPVTD